MIRMEEGNAERSSCSLYRCMKYFLYLNIVILLTLCCSALWSLYQLGRTMGAKSDVTVLDRNYLRYTSNDSQRGVSSHEGARQDDDSSLGGLLKTISSALSELGIRDERLRSLDGSKNGQLLVTNLTDLEIRMLKEYARLNTRAGSGRFRSRRTIKGVEDTSKCDLDFSLDTGDQGRLKVVVRPVKYGEGVVNVENVVQDSDIKDTGEKTVHECIFDVSFEPKAKSFPNRV